VCVDVCVFVCCVFASVSVNTISFEMLDIIVPLVVGDCSIREV